MQRVSCYHRGQYRSPKWLVASPRSGDLRRDTLRSDRRGRKSAMVTAASQVARAFLLPERCKDIGRSVICDIAVEGEDASPPYLLFPRWDLLNASTAALKRPDT